MKNYSSIKNGWFSEVCPMWPGYASSFEITDVLFCEKSDFQEIAVYQTRHHGRMLVLDGIIQLTDFDEFTYQEMLAHVPLFAHPDPEKVLVIGGGDGGILREAGRHACIKQIDYCEIDEKVIQVSKQFFPGLACGFDDPRVRIFIQDGVRFIKERAGQYDVIIVDSSDPIGPAVELFEKPFYRSLKAGLRPGGLVASQGESIFYDRDTIADMGRIVGELFDQSAYASIMVPTYPGGQIGICLGSMGPEPSRPNRPVTEDVLNPLKYYSPDIHRAAFILPRFVKDLLENGRAHA